MSYTVLVPTSTVAVQGTYVSVGGSTPAIISDLSNSGAPNYSTYVGKSSLLATDYIMFSLSDMPYGIPTNEVVDYVYGEIAWIAQNTHFMTGTQNPKLSLNEYYSAGDTTAGIESSLSYNTGSTVSVQVLQSSANQLVRPKGGTAWTLSAINALAIKVKDPGNRHAGTGAYTAVCVPVADLGAVVMTASVPLAPTVAGPSGTITDTLQPTATWTPLDITQYTVTNKQSIGTTKVLTIGTHTIQPGNDIVVALGDVNFDSTFNSTTGLTVNKVTAVTGTTVTYVNSVTATSNTAISVANGVSVGDGAYSGSVANYAVQTQFRMKVFSAAQWGAGGFNPETSTSVYDTGTLVSPATNAVITGGLVNLTANYKVYVKTAKTLVNGTVVWGPWGAGPSFTPNIVAPNTPVFSATWDSTNQRTNITCTSTLNMIPTTDDANFEGGLGSWGALTNNTTTVSATFADTGTQSMRMSSTAAGTMTSAMATKFPAKAGTVYSVTSRVRSGASARTCQVGIDWYDANGTFISTSMGAGATSSTGAFTTITTTNQTAPAGTAYALIRAQVVSTAAGAELHYWDTFAMAPGATAPVWTPGGVVSAYYVITRLDASGVVKYVRDGNGSLLDGVSTPVDLSTQNLSFSDPECVRNTATVTYAAYVVVNSATFTNNSLTATVATVTPATDGNWWLNAINSPNKVNGAKPSVLSHSVSPTELQATYNPLGRSYPVVVTAGIQGSTGSLEIFVPDATQFALIDAMIDSDDTLLLKSPALIAGGNVNRQFYIKPQSRQYSERLIGTRQMWSISLDYVEVAPQ